MIKTQDIIEKLASGIDSALMNVDPDVVRMLRSAGEQETNERAKWALGQILENDEIAAKDRCYACQDTGIAIIFAEVGQSAAFDGSLEDAIQQGVRLGYRDARKSIAHPLTRKNTEDNTPAVIYYDIVPGNGLKLHYLAKGAGSENMGGVAMLTPSKGRSGIIAAVTDIVKRAGANPCPPVIVGVGIGGTMDKAALLSKKALIRKAGLPNSDADIAALEHEILSAVNALSIGAQGFGGNTTALYAACEVFPTHIGMLPVAVTVQCHSARHCCLEFQG